VLFYKFSKTFPSCLIPWYIARFIFGILTVRLGCRLVMFLYLSEWHSWQPPAPQSLLMTALIIFIPIELPASCCWLHGVHGEAYTPHQPGRITGACGRFKLIYIHSLSHVLIYDMFSNTKTLVVNNNMREINHDVFVEEFSFFYVHIMCVRVRTRSVSQAGGLRRTDGRMGTHALQPAR